MDLSSEVLERALAGHAAEVGLLVQQLTPAIQSAVARALVRWGWRSRGRSIRQDLEDIVQEVFLQLFADDGKVLRSWDARLGASLPSFVGLIAYRRALAVLRQQKHVTAADRDLSARELSPQAKDGTSSSMGLAAGNDFAGVTPEEQVSARQALRRLLFRLEEELTPLGQRLFELLYLEQRSVLQVCEQLGMTPDAVYAWRSRLARKAAELLRELSDEPLAPAGAQAGTSASPAEAMMGSRGGVSEIPAFRPTSPRGDTK